MTEYKKYIRKYWGLFLIGILFLSLETFADLMQPMLVSKLIDRGVIAEELSIILKYGLMMIGMTVLGMIGALMRNWIATHVSYNFAKELRQDLYEKLLKFPMLNVEKFERGSLISRLTYDVNMVQQFVNGLMRIFLKAPLLAIGSFIMVLNLNTKFLGVYLSIIPITILVVIVNLKIGYPLYEKIQTILDSLNQKTMEFLSGIRTVKAFNQYDNENAQFDRVSNEYRIVTTRTMRIMAVFGPIILFVVNLAVVFVVYVGKTWVLKGEVGVGEIVAFTNYMTQLYFSLSIVTRIFNVFIRAKASANRINEVLSFENEHYTTGDELPEDGRISFDQVSFHYGQGAPTIDRMSFDIKSGEKIGILGSTGSGKSTLIHMMNGLLVPGDGDVYIGGHNQKNIEPRILKKTIAYVPQQHTLFSGSVLDNLLLGSEVPEEDKLIEVLKVSMAYPFVSEMADGWHTRLGKNGVNISGGQKQRLSIARALLHNPKILLLDDSMSAVDVITERALKRNLFNMPGLTLVFVAQKISTVMDLDRILVLNRGVLEAIGKHDELIESSPTYKAMYQAEFALKEDIR